jgi:hypothetical protein
MFLSSNVAIFLIVLLRYKLQCSDIIFSDFNLSLTAILLYFVLIILVLLYSTLLYRSDNRLY